MQVEIVKPTRVYRISNDAVKVLFPFMGKTIQQIKQPDHLTKRLVIRSSSLPVDRHIERLDHSFIRITDAKPTGPYFSPSRASSMEDSPRRTLSTRSKSRILRRSSPQKLALLMPSDEGARSPKIQFPLLIKFKGESPTGSSSPKSPQKDVDRSFFSKSSLKDTNHYDKPEVVRISPKFDSSPSGTLYFMPILRDLLEKLMSEHEHANQTKFPQNRTRFRFRSPTYDFFTKSLNAVRALATDSLVDECSYLGMMKLQEDLSSKLETVVLFNDQSAGKIVQKPLLVLELENVLIHRPVRGRLYHPRASGLEVPCPDNLTHSYTYSAEDKFPLKKFYARPHLQNFLEDISQHYTIHVFTRLDQHQARRILQAIDPKQKYVSKLFDAQFLVPTAKGFWVKDLRIFHKEAGLSSVVQVDSQLASFFPQLSNGIPILPFEDNPDDRELFFLKHYLLELRKSTNMQTSNARHFQLEKYLEFGSALRILQSLFPPKVPSYYGV